MTGVILFRAQPFHNGHLSMIKKAYSDLKESEHLYIFLGSADKSGTKRNPLPISFRKMLIEGALRQTYSIKDLQRIHIIPLEDLTDESDNSYNWGRYLFMKMLIHTKDLDMTIYYSDDPKIMLNWFSSDERWCLRFKFLDRYEDISATKVRNFIKENDDTNLRIVLPEYVYSYLDEIKEYMNKAEEEV